MAKRALLVGINAYANSRFNLRGCLNDIESLARLLADIYGFAGGDFRFLRDGAATRQAILAGLSEMLAAAVAGDTLVFAFSGHGTQTASTDPGESDRKDECLVPHEGSFASLIHDDELRALFDRYVDSSIKLTAIYDCCHAGTMMRTLALDAEGVLVEDVVNRCLPIEELAGLAVRDFGIGPYNILAACRDDQTAADVREAGPERLPRGAFSYALHTLLRGARDLPVALAEPRIAAGIATISAHTQTPSYTLIDTGSPLIRY